MSRKTSILFWLSIGVICIIGSAIAILMFVAVDAFLKTNIINTLGLTGMIISGCVANAVFAALAHQATKMEKGGEHALYRL